MPSTLYHTFKNFVRGWSGYHISRVDIRKISNVKYHKRLFCIFDAEYEYTLFFSYYNPHSELAVAPIIGGKGGIVLTSEYSETSTVTLRFKTLKDVNAEIDSINKLKHMIEKYDAAKSDKITKFCENSV